MVTVNTQSDNGHPWLLVRRFGPGPGAIPILYRASTAGINKWQEQRGDTLHDMWQWSEQIGVSQDVAVVREGGRIVWELGLTRSN